MTPLRVGLTGGIGSGKTTVANLFAQRGATLIDADKIAHELTLRGTPSYTAIIKHFGADILTKTAELDRQKLRELIFKNPEAKQWLEKRLHPLILQAICEQISQSFSPYCIIVIPLLVETRMKLDFLDRVCVIDAPETLRVQWASQRDQVAPADILAIMSSQSSREERLAIADDVIINDRDLEALEDQVKKLHQQYLQIALP